MVNGGSPRPPRARPSPSIGAAADLGVVRSLLGVEMKLRAVCLLALSIPAIAEEGRSPRVLSTGSSTVSVPADRARLTIGVTAKAQRAKEAAAKVAVLINAVRDALVGLGFERTSLPSADYSVSTVDEPDGRSVKAYAASSSLVAELTNLSQLGAVVDAALAAGATDVSDIDFIAKNSEAARDGALAAAFQQARHDAEVLARVAGGRLGALLSVSTERSYEVSGETIAVSAGPYGGSTHIPPPEVSINGSVRAEWLLDLAHTETP